MSLHVVVHHNTMIKGAVGVWLGPWVISFDSGSSVKACWITSQRLSRAQSEEMHACRPSPNAPANLNQHHKSLV